MTDQNMEHPTLGRRRRHKSPPSLQCTSALPVPGLADHLDTEIGPSYEDGGKEAKRQKSEPTTPISTSSRLPYEHDEVMGITQVDPREAERFEEGCIRSATMQLKSHQTQTNRNLSICLVFPTGVVVVHHCENV